MAVEPQVDNIGAFQLLAKACYDLAALSNKLHLEKRSSEQLIYKRMLWSTQKVFFCHTIYLICSLQQYVQPLSANPTMMNS